MALRLLRRVRDFAEVANEDIIELERAKYALSQLGVNEVGFDEQDIKLIELLLSAKGKPMGLGTISAILSEDEGTIEDVIEPYLIGNGGYYSEERNSQRGLRRLGLREEGPLFRKEGLRI